MNDITDVLLGCVLLPVLVLNKLYYVKLSFQVHVYLTGMIEIVITS